MRFSQIVGPVFFHIGLKRRDAKLVDLHFMGAAHHRARMLECDDDTQDQEFHEIRYFAHLRHMLTVVYRRGDFRYAQDPSLRGMDERENWYPDYFTWPDPTMFSEIPADHRFEIGQPYLGDRYLKSFAPPKMGADLTADGFVKIRGSVGKA